MHRRSLPKRHQVMVSLQTVVTLTMLAVFSLNVMGVLCIIFFVGFGKMSFSDKVVLTLIGETVAVAGGIFTAITRFIFPK
jgi:hypothetical protein